VIFLSNEVLQNKLKVKIKKSTEVGNTEIAELLEINLDLVQSIKLE
jgi:hypothetical protein